MGIDYSSSVAIGFRVDADDLQVFSKELPEKSHMEERFDPKSGKSIGKVKVVDEEERTSWVLNGEEFDHRSELVDAICGKVNAQSWMDGSFYDDDENMNYVIGPNFPRKNVRDEGKLTIDGELTLGQVVELQPEIDRIRTELAKLGLKVGAPVITSTLLVS